MVTDWLHDDQAMLQNCIPVACCLLSYLHKGRATFQGFLHMPDIWLCSVQPPTRSSTPTALSASRRTLTKSFPTPTTLPSAPSTAPAAPTVSPGPVLLVRPLQFPLHTMGRHCAAASETLLAAEQRIMKEDAETLFLLQVEPRMCRHVT